MDDTPGNLVALEAVLDSEFRLLFASSGAEAIALAEKGDIDVVLMDIQMPVMDGFQTAERIKKIESCKDVPIVFITAIFNEDPYIKRGYQVGGVDYFTKPFDPDLLRFKMGIYASFRQKAAVLKEREEQIRQTEELLNTGRKLSAVLESLPVGILISDIDGRIIQTNDEVSRIFKATEIIEHDAYGEMLGWWSSEGEGLAIKKGPLAGVLQNGQSSHNEKIRVLCFDGSAKTIIASTSPLLGVGGKIVGAVIVLKDMTESKQVEQEFETQVARLVSVGLELEHALDQPRDS